MERVAWVGKPPEICEVCGTKIYTCFIDGRLDDGRWAVMCLECWFNFGVGLGVGEGQKYQLENGKWVKMF